MTTVATTADLGVTVLDSPDPVTLNSNLTYAIVITNQGPAAANGVTLTNTLPSSVTFLSATSTQGTNTRVSNVITYSLGSLASGASITALIQVSRRYVFCYSPCSDDSENANPICHDLPWQLGEDRVLSHKYPPPPTSIVQD